MNSKAVEIASFINSNVVITDNFINSHTVCTASLNHSNSWYAQTTAAINAAITPITINTVLETAAATVAKTTLIAANPDTSAGINPINFNIGPITIRNIELIVAENLMKSCKIGRASCRE